MKVLVLNIKVLRNIISSRLYSLAHKYKNTPYKINYEKIDKRFFKHFSFFFIQYGNILFYLTLRSMCSGLNGNESSLIRDKRKNVIIISIVESNAINVYADVMKKILKEYKHRSLLKLEKQKEINEKAKQKELEEKRDNQMMLENKAITQKQMYKRFVDYIHGKEAQNAVGSKNNVQTGNGGKSESIKNSFFFTGIDSIKSQSKFLGSSSSSSLIEDTKNRTRYNKNKDIKLSISFKQKEIFLEQNKNKLITLFSKFQNSLVKENDKNIYFQKKSMKKLKNIKSEFIPVKKTIKTFNFNNIGLLNRHKKMATIAEEESSNRRRPPKNLFDENYEYDEEDNSTIVKKGNIIHKRNDSNNYYTFFRLNEDRANIYKKMNDLRKLQMSYFGGRFLNTKVNFSSFGERSLDDYLNNYYSKQTHDTYYNNKKNRLLNYQRKNVYDITANQKIRSKTPSFGRAKINFKKCFSDENRGKEKKKNNATLIDFRHSKKNFKNFKHKKSPVNSRNKTQRVIDKNKFPYFSSISINNRTLSTNNIHSKKKK